MTYCIVLLYSFTFLYIFSGNYKNNIARINEKALNFILSIPAFLWLIVLGTQYYVGTDYPTYYKYFDSGIDLGLYLVKKEYLFYWLSYFIYKSIFPAQTGFFLFSFIQVFFLCKFLLKMKTDRLDIFIIVYFCCATCFYNQMNALRQYTAMAIFLYSIFFILERKLIKYCACIFFAAMFHISALFLIVLYPFYFLFNLKSGKLYRLFLFLSLLLMYKGIDSLVTFFVAKTSYSFYLNTFYFLEQNRKSFKNIITKLIFFPFYLRVIYWFPVYIKDYTNRDVFLIKLGIIFYGIKLIAMSSFFLSRFSMYFDLIAYVPLYYYLRELIRHNTIKKWQRMIELLLFLSISLGLWFVKVIIAPSGEYAYQSVLFR